MRKPVGQLAVVGDQDQSFARFVEPSDREQALVAGGQIDYPRAARWIAVGGQNADRLVDREIDQAAPAQRFAIDANLLPLRIDSRAQFGDGFAVDIDAAFADQFFALTAAADARGGQYLLQPYAFGRLRRLAVPLPARCFFQGGVPP